MGNYYMIPCNNYLYGYHLVIVNFSVKSLSNILIEESFLHCIDI